MGGRMAPVYQQPPPLFHRNQTWAGLFLLPGHSRYYRLARRVLVMHIVYLFDNRRSPSLTDEIMRSVHSLGVASTVACNGNNTDWANCHHKLPETRARQCKQPCIACNPSVQVLRNSTHVLHIQTKCLSISPARHISGRRHCSIRRIRAHRCVQISAGSSYSWI